VNEHAVTQRSEAWFNARKGMPTCSRFDSILTPKTGKPASAQDTLINELIAESILPPEAGLIKPQFMSEEMEQGIILEAEARCAYELEFAPEPVREAGFITHDSGLFGGSPDALVGESGGVEIKCPALATHIGYIRDGELPPAYRCQVHGYLIVTGRAWWDFFSYARNAPPFRLRVERDDFTAKLEAELHAFVARYNAERAKFNLPPIGKTQTN
jgi:hypothetical protein